MGRGVLVAMVLAAGASCSDGSGDGPVDAPPDPGPCRSSEPFVREIPLSITHAGQAVIPRGLSSDELTAYFTVAGEPPYNTDLYAATRASLDDPFVDGVALIGVNSGMPEGGAEESRDGLELLFVREDNVGITIHIYRATRSSRTGSFTNVERVSLAQLQLAPSLSSDGSELFYIYLSSYISSTPLIYRADRVGTTFGAGQQVVGPPGSSELGSPVISADGLTLYYSVTDTGRRTWYRRRGGPGQPFSPTATLLTVGAGPESPLWESSDGCRLYVARSRDTVILSRRP